MFELLDFFRRYNIIEMREVYATSQEDITLPNN